MKLIQNLISKKVNLGKVELIYAVTYFLIGKILASLAGEGYALLAMGILIFIFTILLIVFFRQHVYAQDKPLLAALSIYYKSTVYCATSFIMCNLPMKNYFLGTTLILMIFYMVLSYIFGKKYNEMLIAYLYGNMIVLAGQF